MASEYHELSDSIVYNHDFAFSNDSGSFAAGWQKHRGRKNSSYYWEKNYDSFCIKIKNKADQLSSICQQKLYKVPVFREQVWEAGVIIKASKNCRTTLIVNFISRNSSHVVQSSIDLLADPDENYYYEVVSVPAGIDYAYLEIGIKEAGTIWIKDVMFRRVFPVNEYSTDIQGRFNVNSVETVKELLEPIRVKGPVDVRGVLTKQSQDFVEEVAAGTEEKTSTVQDVLYMNNYCFCVLNQGSETVRVTLQISPNNVNWVNDDYVYKRVKAGEMKIFVPNYFLRYIRLVYGTETPTSTNNNLLIYFQAQG